MLNCSLSKPATDFQVEVPSMPAVIGGVLVMLGAAGGDMWEQRSETDPPCYWKLESWELQPFTAWPDPSVPTATSSWPQQPGKERVISSCSRHCSQPGEWH